MREIKFRAWDKLPKQMRYQDKEFFHIALRRNLKGNEFWKECGESIDNFFTPEQGTIMQYTGLKGKNGKEIYEGDIVRYELFGGLATIYEIYWSVDYCGFCYKPTSPYTNVSLEKDKASNFEVIGNIYENPELLKEKRENANRNSRTKEI